MKQYQRFVPTGVYELEPRKEFGLYCYYLAFRVQYYVEFGTVDQATSAFQDFVDAGCGG